MRLVSLTLQQRIIKTGRLSDGSDAATSTISWWRAVVIDDDGAQRQIDFSDNGAQPTNQDIIDRVPKFAAVVPSSKADLATYARSLKALWRDWKDIQDEMMARGFASGTAAQQAGLTAVTAQANAAWGDLLTALNNWRTAP